MQILASDRLSKLTNQHCATIPFYISCCRFHHQSHFTTDAVYVLFISTMLAVLLSQASLILFSYLKHASLQISNVGGFHNDKDSNCGHHTLISCGLAGGQQSSS